MPTLVDNNANAAALGELYYGLGAGVANFIYVAIGTVSAQDWSSTANCTAAHATASARSGTSPSPQTAPPCSCGRVGCLESLASGSAIEQMAQASLSRTEADGSTLSEQAKITAKDVFRRAAKGDPAAAAIVDKALDYLAIGIGNMVNLLNPDQVILGGGITRSGDYFMGYFLPKIRPRLLPEQNGDVQFRLSESNEDSGLRGAATLVIQQLFGAVHSQPGGSDGGTTRSPG